MADRATFAKTLDDQLRESRISQSDFADAIGVSKSIVTLWINGKSYPRIDTIQKIADYFGVSTDYLVTGNRVVKNLKAADHFEIPENGIQFVISGEDIELLKSIKKLNETNRSKLLDQLKMLQLMQMIDESRP